MDNSIIPWNSDRFEIREYKETGAVYICDKIYNVGYVNQTETARLAETSQQAISKTTKKPPKQLQTLRGIDSTIQPFTIQKPNGGQNYECYNNEDFANIIYYYAHYAKGNEDRFKAREHLHKVVLAGSLAFILHQTGVKVQPVYDEPVPLEYCNQHERNKSRLHGTEIRKAYTEALQIEYNMNFKQWVIKEGLDRESFFAKWTNFTYNLLFGTNARGLRSIPEAYGKMIIGRNHLSSETMINAIMSVEDYVASVYDNRDCNNLKKLHIEGSVAASQRYKLKSSECFQKNLLLLPEMPDKHIPSLPEA